MRFLILFGLAVGLGACTIDNNLGVEEPETPLPWPPADVNTITEDRFIQIQQPKVDVLFVVDNSSSMGEEQIVLAENFPLMMEYFVESGLDYHIGLVATDAVRPEYSGKLRVFQGHRFIDKDTSDPGAIFNGMTAALGVISGSIESGRAAAYQALELHRDSPRNHGFYRPEAELHIIFVSDADDQTQSLNNPPVTFGEFMSWAGNLKSPAELTTMHAIVVLPNGGGNCSSFRVGSTYINYANASGGILQSICEQDWGPTLDALGLQTTGLKQEFFLTRLPVINPNTIKVKVRFPAPDVSGQDVTLAFNVCLVGEEIEDETCQVVYSPGRNSITFLEFVADPLAEVLITYTRREDYSADNDILDDEEG